MYKQIQCLLFSRIKRTRNSLKSNNETNNRDNDKNRKDKNEYTPYNN